MLVEDLERMIELAAPRALAESWDNVGLLVGRRGTELRRVLVALDLTEEVVKEAVVEGFQAIITHHPLLFAPITRVTDADRVGVLITQLVAADVALLAAHTNLDGAPGGLCDLVAREMGLAHILPLARTPSRVKKLVGFIPEGEVERVSRAVFEAGGGRIGDYQGCSFENRGEGTFVAGPSTHPTVGRAGESVRVAEVRWETIVPENRVVAAVQAFICAHPYEEPAFDVYPVENVSLTGGQGRVGSTRSEVSLVALAETAAEVFGLPEVSFAGDIEHMVDRVAVVTGSGSSFIAEAARSADVLLTGDLKYHDAEKAADAGLALVAVPHGHLETWALRRWCEGFGAAVAEHDVEVVFSQAGRSPWHAAKSVSHAGEANGVVRLFDLEEAGGERVGGPDSDDAPNGEPTRTFTLRVDGASRGNPGPGAIGVVLEDEQGEIVEELGARIGVATNNQAEYQALITGLETALDRSIGRLRILSDSELLVRQLRGEYRVKSEQLKELYLQARALVQRFERVEIVHVAREENSRPDELANQALDGGR
ncbi:MAG TPA: Nif3-like dinuclear metal center hexameric protein [Thermoleophilia bacterium]|nr:Nif3-like dinuclear metal center hexameric protein [Thermoleophilia bacterium]